jgi:hypothetical protein
MSKAFSLNLSNSVEPQISKMSIDELRKFQSYKEQVEQKYDLCPEAQFMAKDNELVQKVLISTLTDTIKSKTKGRPKKNEK